MANRDRSRSPVYGLIISAALAAANPLPAFAEEPHQFDITAADTTRAIHEFGAQSGIQILVSAEHLAGKKLNEVAGTHSTDAGLRILLAGTGLTHLYVGARTVAVVQAAPEREKQDERGMHPGEPPVQLEEVVITGTHIRGNAPAGSKVVTIDRTDIALSGYGRVEDVLQALPQNFSGGVNEFSNADSGAVNFNRGHAVDLRGLGVSSTLTLVNGRRQAAGGLEGSFVDISSIPTLAIERIEILPEGASAIYGSDAIGGVVNFVLRKDFDGAETSVRAATADGYADEYQASQMLGTHWGTGNVLAGYQYYRRNELPASAGYYSSAGGDMRRFGGADFRQPRGNPGTIVNSANAPAYAIPEGQDGRDLSPSDFIPGAANFQDRVTGSAALPEQETHGLFLYGSQRIGEGWEFFTDARFSTREMRLPFPASTGIFTVTSANPFYANPTGGTGPVRVAYDFIEDLGNTVQVGDIDTLSGTAGITASLGASWQMSLAGTYARERNRWSQINQAASAATNLALADTNPATSLNIFGDGSNNNPATLDALRATSTGDATSQVRSASLLANGPLFDLPGGTVRMALGIDERKEELEAERGVLIPSTGVYTRSGSSIGAMERDVSAVFGELALPLIGERSGKPGVKRLELSIAGRYEDYSDFGTTFNPKVGLAWSPFATLALRSTWGTSFRAPRLNELNPNVNPPSSTISSNVLDPRSPTGRSNVLELGGNNADIAEETADVWTLGLDWSPVAFEGLHASLTYFNFDYKDKIGAPPGSSTVLAAEGEWAEVITRAPTQAQVDEICDRADFRGTCLPASSIGAIVDGRLRNLAGVKVDGVDVDLSQTLRTGHGTFVVALSGTYTLEYERAVSSNAPFVSIVDTVGNPLALRARARVSWSLRGWGANLLVNHIGAYEDPTRNRPVDAWTTMDVALTHRFSGNGSPILAGLSVSLNAVNALDERPPFVDRIAGYDSASARELGRLVSVLVTKQW